MGSDKLTPAQRILASLDEFLDTRADITLYGRAAFALGFNQDWQEWVMSKDVDIILWLGQAEDLLEATNFWDAINKTNKRFESEGLFVSHLFEETQVVLRPDWRLFRVEIPGEWKNLDLHRLADEDLFLTKLMRNDPLDWEDADFIVQHAGWSKTKTQEIIKQARVPDVPEIHREFQLCLKRYA